MTVENDLSWRPLTTLLTCGQFLLSLGVIERDEERSKSAEGVERQKNEPG